MPFSPLNIGGRTFNWGERTFIMGILNVTPDSFSGDGLLSGTAGEDTERGKAGMQAPLDEGERVRAAVDQARRFVEAGADILDVGGESTRPGAEPVGAEQELVRVIPVIRALRAAFDTPISIDTYKSSVAEAALEAGANLINDIWGLHADPELAGAAARSGVPVILMHNRSSWAHAEIRERLGGRYVGIPYENLIEDIRRELLESVHIAHAAGIPDDHIIVDPGIGFGKSVEQNLELLDRLGEIRSLGYPLLAGPSRKSFIGYTLNLPPDQRIEGTAAAVAVAIVRGADILRIHDVESMARVARMTDAIVRRRLNEQV